MSTDAYVSPDIASLMGLIDTHLRWKQLQSKGDRKYHHYHPSELGKCLRRQQYKHLAERGFLNVEFVPFSSQQQRLFDKGHNMHERWQQWYFADMGILRGVWECPRCRKKYGREEKIGIFMPESCSDCGFDGEFTYKEVRVFDEEMNLTGHVDIILDFSKLDVEKYKGVRKNFNADVFPKNPIVVDMKSIGSWQWREKVKKYGLHKEYKIQIILYTHLLDCEYGVVIYENKDNSTAAAYKVDRDDDIFNEVKKQTIMMQSLANNEKDGQPRPLLPPPRPDDKGCYECKNCEFAEHCHKSAIWDDPDLQKKRIKFYGITL